MTPIQRAAALAHAASSGYKRRVAKSAEMLREFSDYAVAISWGKDSVAMLHLAATVRPVIAIHGRYSENEELPDIPTIRDKILYMLGAAVKNYVEVPVRGDWEVAEIIGHPLWEAQTAAHRALLKEIRSELIGNTQTAAENLGAQGMCIGLAAHESQGRKMNAIMRGEHYSVAGRLPTLAPLQWWLADDVIAYHVANNLPWLHIYDTAPDPRRARSEISMATGGVDARRRITKWMEWRQAYPELCARWESRWPGWCDR